MKSLLIFSSFVLVQLIYSQDINKDFYLVDNLKIEEYSYSDRNVLDSALNIYHKAQNDTARINALDIIIEYMTHDDWAKYNIIIYKIAKKQLLNNPDKLSKNRYMTAIAGCMTNTGYLYNVKGNLTKALECYLISLKIQENLDDLDGLAAGTLNNIGSIYDMLGDYTKAMEYYKRALTLYETRENERGKAIIYNNIGFIHNSNGEFKLALEYLQKALDIKLKMNDTIDIINTYNNIGITYHKQKDYEKASEYTNSALYLAKKINSKRGISISLLNLGKIENSIGNYSTAKKLTEESFKISNSLNDKESIMNSTELLSTLYEKENKWEEAYQMQKKYYTLRDSIASETTAKSIIRQELQYEYESKKALDKIEHEKQLAIEMAEKNKQKTLIYFFIFFSLITVLLSVFLYRLYKEKNKNNIQLEFQKKEIQQHLENTQRLQNALKQDLNKYMQMALRKQMNPHFLFNALNSIQNYILLNDKLAANLYLSQFASLMRKVLEYSQNELILLSEELETLELYIKIEACRFPDKFEHKIIIDENIDITKNKIPPLILQPFIENSIWHGVMHNDKKGEIRICIEKDKKDDLIVIRITDNGIGRKKSAEITKNKKAAHKSMGIQITKDRLSLTNSLNQINMSIEYIDLEDNQGNSLGTEVLIRLPFI